MRDLLADVWVLGSTRSGIATRWENALSFGIGRLKVSIRWSGEETQGYKQGRTAISSTSVYSLFLFLFLLSLSPSPDLFELCDLLKLTATTKVNPDILGGLVVEIGGRTIDLSVSSKIAKMNKLLTDTL